VKSYIVYVEGKKRIRHFWKSLGISRNAYAIEMMLFRIPITLLGLGLGIRGWNPLLVKN